MTKGLERKVRMFWGLISKFVEVRGEKLVGGRLESFWLPSPIQKKVNWHFYKDVLIVTLSSYYYSSEMFYLMSRTRFIWLLWNLNISKKVIFRLDRVNLLAFLFSPTFYFVLKKIISSCERKLLHYITMIDYMHLQNLAQYL